MFEAITAKVQQLLNRVGQSTDTANASGNLHQKLADVKNFLTGNITGQVATQASVNAIPTTPMKQRSAKKLVSPQLNLTGANTPLLTVNGVGSLEKIMFGTVSGTGSTSAAVIALLIDGIEIARTNNANQGGLAAMMLNVVVNAGNGDVYLGWNADNAGPMNLQFKSSIQLQLISGTLTQAYVGLLYNLE